MTILFCSDPLSPSQPDRAYDAEVAAARAAGLEFELVNFERLTRDENAALATRRVAAREMPGTAIYRGWMLRPQNYQELYDALKERNLLLINDPNQYRHCHLLPESYSVIESQTPRTVWVPLEDLNFDSIMNLLAPFGNRPLVLKDYVKSRKHEWWEACYIPNASNRADVGRVVECFMELQGDELNEGLVFRQWVDLKQIGTHSRSEMPLAREFRLFFLDGQLLQSSRYWAQGDYGDETPLEQFEPIARRVRSRFFTMDVAQKVDGDWIIVELGDGQVAGLPDENEAPHFYRALASLRLT